MKPTVIDDDEFEYKLKTVQEKIEILTDDAKSGAGGGDRSLVERLNDLHDRLKTVGNLLDNSESVEVTISNEVAQALDHVSITEDTNVAARNELSVSVENGFLWATKALKKLHSSTLWSFFKLMALLLWLELKIVPINLVNSPNKLVKFLVRQEHKLIDWRNKLNKTNRMLKKLTKKHPKLMN